MEKYVRVRKRNLFFMILLSLVIALLITTLFYTGFVAFNKAQELVFADKSDNLSLEKVVVTEERVSPIFKEVEVENIIEPVSMRKVGAFKLTAYCPCSKCCDQWGASPEGKHGSLGVGVYQGVTFAVDPKVIPYGTKMYVEGVGVGIATDCGGAIKKNRIDVYFTDHNEALVFGTGGGYAHNVYIIE